MHPAFRLSLFYTAFFLGWGCLLPYWSVWYAGRGLSPEAIGVAAGVGLLARMLVSPVAAFLSDGAARAKDPLILLSWLALAFWLAHTPVRDPALLTLLAFLTGAAVYPIIPLSDGLTYREAARGGFAFGPVRAVGSAAFIVSNLASGALIGWLGGEAMLRWMLGATLLMGMASLLLPQGRREGPIEPARARLRGVGQLLRRREFVLALLGSSFIAGSHAFHYSFSALAWSAAGYDTMWVGALWGFSVACETVFLALSGRIVGRVGPLGLMALGGVAALIRWIGCAAAPGLPVLFALQTLHAFSFGATYLGFTRFAGRVAGPGRLSVAFALNSSLSGGAFSAVLVALSGLLFARYGQAGFLAMVVPALMGLACIGLLWLRPGAQPHSAGEGGAMDAPR